MEHEKEFLPHNIQIKTSINSTPYFRRRLRDLLFRLPGDDSYSTDKPLGEIANVHFHPPTAIIYWYSSIPRSLFKGFALVFCEIIKKGELAYFVSHDFEKIGYAIWRGGIHEVIFPACIRLANGTIMPASEFDFIRNAKIEKVPSVRRLRIPK